MDRRWHVRAAAIPVALLVLSFVGCARRPSSTQVSGPSPRGSASAGASSWDGPGSDDASMAPNDGTVEGDVGNDTSQGGGTASGRRGRGSARHGGATGAAGGGAATQDGAQSGMMTAAARPHPTQFSQAPGLPDIHFEYDRYEIRPEDAKTLDTNAEWLRSNPTALLLIEGHCDERGTNGYNIALGAHRAKSAMNYLIGQGIKASRITTISYGEERPLCAEHTETCWGENRRSHFLVKSR